MLGLVRAGRVAPGVAAALRRPMPRSALHLEHGATRPALGSLDAKAMDEELLGELAVRLQLSISSVTSGPDGHGLQRDDVAARRNPSGRKKSVMQIRSWAGWRGQQSESSSRSRSSGSKRRAHCRRRSTGSNPASPAGSGSPARPTSVRGAGGNLRRAASPNPHP